MVVQLRATYKPLVWNFTGRGGFDEEGHDEHRSSVDLRIGARTEWRLAEGRAMRKWDARTIARANRRHLEDMPWCGEIPPVVSDRLKQFLEAHAPGDAQYLPVRIRYHNKDIPAPRYWVLNCLRVADCIDRRRSLVRPSMHDEDDYFFSKLVINPKRIHQRVMLCRVKYDEVMLLIRDSLKSRIEAAGMTGCQFYDPNWP